MGDYLYKDPEVLKLDHPDAAIRLVSVVHRFHVPKISTNRTISFAKSFQTVGQHPKTRKLMFNADDIRKQLQEGCNNTNKKISSERIINDARRYIPLIHNILVSCKVQPENARLDEKLLFEWMSGIEENPKAFVSEAIMFDLTMAIVCEGLGHALSATEYSIGGQFTAASREYAIASGIMEFLHDQHLPKWVSKGSNVIPEKLPSECHIAATKALQTLFMVNGQQMAVATVLMKPGKPNYSLLGKLCFGIKEGLEDFMVMIRKDAMEAKERMDKDFFVLMAFQTGIQLALSLYFQAQAAWEQDDNYGIAIALMSEATIALKTRESILLPGLPDITKTPALIPLKKDLLEFRKHCNLLLSTWEKDNSCIYFASVPQKLSSEKKLQVGLRMNKVVSYQLEEAEPVLLVLPEGTTAEAAAKQLERSDSDLARELQEKLNAGEDL